MELFLQSIVNSVIQGGFFALWAVGLVLIFGVMGVVNFAHGELMLHDQGLRHAMPTPIWIG